MQINNNGITNNTANGSSNTQKSGSSAKVEGNTNSSGEAGDSVELSQAARVMTELESKIIASADVDTSRVESIRQSIADGSYSVDADSIASKMLSNDDLF